MEPRASITLGFSAVGGISTLMPSAKEIKPTSSAEALISTYRFAAVQASSTAFFDMESEWSMTSTVASEESPVD